MKTGMLALSVVCAALAQDPAALPSFEVATIKASAPPTGNRIMVGMGGDPGRMDLKFVNLRMMIARAYGIKDIQISGPDWMQSERFDVLAKIPPDTSKEKANQMLQRLLIERFGLKFHNEERTVPIYALVVAKGGPKAKPAEAEQAMRMMMSPVGRQLNGKATFARLADALANFLDKPVIDETGLAGSYDIELQWTPDDRDRMGGKMAGIMAPPGGPAVAGKGPDAPHGEDFANAPTIFVAVQEKLGLKLEARKGPVKFLIVDAIQKTPTEN